MSDNSSGMKDALTKVGEVADKLLSAAEKVIFYFKKTELTDKEKLLIRAAIIVGVSLAVAVVPTVVDTISAFVNPLIGN